MGCRARWYSAAAPGSRSLTVAAENCWSTFPSRAKGRWKWSGSMSSSAEAMLARPNYEVPRERVVHLRGIRMNAAIQSDEGAFWDRRYQAEGAIWGEAPSPTAWAAVRHLPARARVLEIGFGYGRDLAFLIGRGCKVVGIDLSSEGQRQAEGRSQQRGLKRE